MKNIKFVKEEEELTYNPKQSIQSFYQICQFKNPHTKMFQTRKIIFNEKGDIIRTYEKDYAGKILSKFIKTNPVNKFKIYPVNDISYIDYPNTSDMTIANSELINNNIMEYGNSSYN